MSVRQLLTSVAFSIAALALVVPAASAHPLGNFTINHYTGLRVSPTSVIVDHVTDFAEIPTFSERRAMDTDGDGQVSDSESGAYAQTRCTSLANDLSLAVAGTPAALDLWQLGISFPMGQGSPTMRLVCVYQAALASGSSSIAFADHSFAERQGWREIVVEGAGVTVSSADVPTTSSSHRLTQYPADLLSVPPGQSSASFSVAAGGLALTEFSVPDATPISAGIAPPPVTPPSTSAIPAGVTELGSDVTSLFQAADLTPPIILFSLLLAAGLGALHALSPGHGKTVMAAYLVGSRGNFRQAVGLGLTVTVSHTLGVLALGVLSLSAAFVIQPDKLYPILSVVSGAIVVVIGAYLLFTRIRAWRATRPSHAHDHGHAHENEFGHALNAARPAGWHEHGGKGHTHLPQPTMGRRGLFALGLSGGMIPSVSALLVLIGSISIGRPAWGIVLTIAFGLGMAAVLVGIGLGLVYARRLVERFPVSASLDLGRRIPVLSAVVVLLAGALIAGQGLIGLGL
jgi:ABC-type nickel/cobalt efflux system permease component RcnA